MHIKFVITLLHVIIIRSCAVWSFLYNNFSKFTCYKTVRLFKGLPKSTKFRIIIILDGVDNNNNIDNKTSISEILFSPDLTKGQ